jgi:UDP-glucose 4-epimerase
MNASPDFVPVHDLVDAICLAIDLPRARQRVMKVAMDEAANYDARR